MQVIDKAGTIRPGEKIDPSAVKAFLQENIKGLTGDMTISVSQRVFQPDLFD